MSKHIVIVVEGTSPLMMSLKGNLAAMGYLITVSDTDVASAVKPGTKIDAFVVFATDGTMTGLSYLVKLRDLAISENIPIYTIGTQDELSEFTTVIPSNLIIKSFERPVNIAYVADVIHKRLTSDEETTEKKKILVVDDSGAMLRNVKSWLEVKYQVILANSGTIAFKYLSIDRPDLVILDYEMPIIDGRQVFEMMRSEKEFADIPVMFLTSKSDVESIKKVLQLKPEGYLLKTLKPEQIVEQVDEFFNRNK